MQFVARVLPDDATHKGVTWKSNQTGVTTVSDKGLVTAKGVGNAEITVTTSEGGKTATCYVTVTEKPVSVSGVSVSPSSAEVGIGKSVTLTASLRPSNATNHKLSWSSSNTSITITSPNSSDYSTYSSGVYVLAAGNNYWIRTTSSPSDADDELVYSTDASSSYLTVSSSGQIQAKSYSSSTYTITVKSKNGSASASVKVRVFDKVTGITLYERKSTYIGSGATQKYYVDVTPSTAYAGTVSLKSVSNSKLTASIATASGHNGQLTVKLASLSDSEVCGNGSTYASDVYIEAGPLGSRLTKYFTFNFSKYDPYQVKLGDLIRVTGTTASIHDGGYRGQGVYETSAVTASSYDMAVIAWLGNNHLSDDPTIKNGTHKLSGISKYVNYSGDENTVSAVHGIGVPVNTLGLYRKVSVSGTSGGSSWATSTMGEKWQKKADKVGTMAGHDASLVSTNSNYNKHCAWHNTEVLLEESNSGDSDYDIEAVIYCAGNSSHRHYKFYYGNLAASGNISAYSSVSQPTNVSPWLLPTVGDLRSVFGNAEQITAFTNSVKLFNPSASLSTIRGYWSSNENQEGTYAHAVSLKTSGSSVTGSSELSYQTKTEERGVLPIVYF